MIIALNSGTTNTRFYLLKDDKVLASVKERVGIKDLRGPLSDILYIPVEGVTLSNTASFIKAGSCAIGVGSQLLRKEYIKNMYYDAISELAKEYIREIKNARNT